MPNPTHQFTDHDSPPSRGMSWGSIVCLQVILLILSGMLLDGGYVAMVLLISTAISWTCGAVVAVNRRGRHVPSVLAWSWIASIGLVVAVYQLGDFDARRQASRYRVLMSNNARLLVMACMDYSGEDPKGAWPTDLSSLVSWSEGGLSNKLLQVRWRPELAPALVYVRPGPRASSRQPVILFNPTCDYRGRMVLAYADAHVGYIPDAEQANVVWAEANRLAQLPKARTEGVSLSDWTVGAEQQNQ